MSEARENLLSGTREWSGSWGNADACSADGTHDGFAVMSFKAAYIGLHKSVMLVAGRTYTFSACVRVEPGQSHYVADYLSNVGGDKYLVDSEFDTSWKLFYDVTDGEWHIISHTFTVEASKLALPRVEATGRYGLSVCAYMLAEGDTPAAWSPADGETLAGGGALMSANLWSDSTASMQIRADGTYLAGKAGMAELNSNVTGVARLTENQTIHMGASLTGADAGVLKPFVEYEDAAGNKNWVGFPSWQPTDSWQRFEGTCVVPSGMTICGVGFDNSASTGDIQLANPVFSYGSPVTLASSAHTPYATQDHVKAVYATNADLKIWEDAITSEVSERAKLSGRVGTLESTSSEHTSKITQLSSSIESMVKGEATYTAPDGTTKTSGIYSKIEQTASGINETFGQYTKTADLASTDAVKDAKKAGTDAASAAAAAQSTANTAKTNAATAQSTANTAKTNAATAQSTADAAKTAAANAQSTANTANTTANNLATLIHRGSDGVTVGYSTDGKTFTGGRTRQGTSSFDVLDADGNTTASLASGKVSLLGGDVSMTAYQDGRGFTDCEIHGETYMALSAGSLDTYSSTGNVGLGTVSASTAGASMISQSNQESENSEVSVGDDGFARVYGRKGVAISSDEGGMQLNGGTVIKKRFAGTSVVNSLGSDFDLFSGNDCKSRFGELVMPDEHASWVLLASPGQGGYDHHITLSPTSSGGVHGYITPSVTGNVRVQWLFIKF